MANKTICRWSALVNYGSDHVSPVAGQAANWSVVSKYGDGRFDYAVLPDGYLQIDLVCGDDVCRTTGVVAVSELV